MDMDPTISRRKLSRCVCTWLDWRSSRGDLKEMSCRKALSELNSRGILNLNARDQICTGGSLKGVEFDPEPLRLINQLSELGEIVVEPIVNRRSKDSKLWFSFMERFHYLGAVSLCGAQIRYIIRSEHNGPIGGLSFNSASWSLKARDDYIGWSEAARTANLQKVICNSRFLIVPTLEVKNLASHVLSSALSRLCKDWEARYDIRPVMVETFVEPRYDGACYKASNWKYIGETSGRRDGIPKQIFLYKLHRRWKKVLCSEPEVILGEILRPEQPRSWAEEEFGTARFYDYRLKERLYTIAEDFYNSPKSNIPEACGNIARTMGAYRFFQNGKTTMDVILTAHTEAAIERIKPHKIVLAPQDTTFLNYSTHPMTEGLGPINNKKDKSIGLILHDTLAFTEDGAPLGVLDAQCWARDPNQMGKAAKRKDLPIEQKESMKWLRSYRRVAEVQKLCPNTVLVSVGDRESDIYELFHEAQKTQNGPKLLVRLDKSRKRHTKAGNLWDLMEKKDDVNGGVLNIHIPRRGSNKARDAWVDVRFMEVKLQPPKRLKSLKDVKAWAVYLTEKDPPDPSKAVEWMLLTTAAVNDFEDAKKRIEWYSGRWGIEVYHRTLKSGCRLKDRQLGSADRIETCLGIDMVVAWRIFHLTMLGRETPNLPCTVFFKDVEWKALCCYVSKTAQPPKVPPTLSEAAAMVGKIGGHLGRKGDGFPGAQTLWRGIQRLETAAEMFQILTDQSNPHPMQSGP